MLGFGQLERIASLAVTTPITQIFWHLWPIQATPNVPTVLVFVVTANASHVILSALLVLPENKELAAFHISKHEKLRCLYKSTYAWKVRCCIVSKGASSFLTANAAKSLAGT